MDSLFTSSLVTNLPPRNLFLTAVITILIHDKLGKINRCNDKSINAGISLFIKFSFPNFAIICTFSDIPGIFSIAGVNLYGSFGPLWKKGFFTYIFKIFSCFFDCAIIIFNLFFDLFYFFFYYFLFFIKFYLYILFLIFNYDSS